MGLGKLSLEPLVEGNSNRILGVSPMQNDIGRGLKAPLMIGCDFLEYVYLESQIA